MGERGISGAEVGTEVGYVCAHCRGSFTYVPVGTGKKRAVCDGCRALGGAAPAPPPVPLELPGRPFSREHFAAWALTLTLDSGDPWVVEPWFLDFAEDVFAGVPETWLLVPEGNGKTTGLAGMALYHVEHTSFAWVPWAASSRDQAGIGYIQAEGFVLRSARLSGIFKLHPGYRQIRCSTSHGRLEIFAADARTGDGPIPTWGIIDELHRHRNMNLYRTWTGKLEKRGGQLSTISTAGDPGGEFEMARQAIRSSAGRVDERGRCFRRYVAESVVVHEYAVPKELDLEDVRLVKEANPFSKITPESLRRKRQSPTMTPAHWARFTCNVAVQGEDAAIREGEWDPLGGAEVPAPGVPCWVGLDVGWKWDTTALIPFWMRGREDRVLGPATILTPPRDGSSLAPAAVEAALEAIHEVWPLHTVVMDPSRAEQLAVWIEERFGCRVVERAQSTALLIQDYERFMEAVRNGWLRHTGDAELRQHVLNAVAKLLPTGASYFTRQTSMRSGGDQDLLVIDGLTAAAMVNSAAVGEPAPAQTAYRSRGLLVA